ncbi:MAG: hypothetical protein KDA37_11255 [Planctomycetales bacterium]|nr:hypothetical protein [Planctomycetales bacterium]
MTSSPDCVVVGASLARLACASVLANSGLSVRLLERKHDAGDKLHTTGIIVKDAAEQIALLDRMPRDLVPSRARRAFVFAEYAVR